MNKNLYTNLPKIQNRILSRLYQIDYPPPHFFYYNKKSLMKTVQRDFELVYDFYLTEVPWSGLLGRFYQIPSPLKYFLILAALAYRMALFRFLFQQIRDLHGEWADILALEKMRLH